MNPDHIERRIVSTGQRSHGIVTRSQLIDIGCSEFQVDYRLKRGTLWPLFRSAYAVGGPAQTWRAIWLAAVRSAGDGSMLAGLAAAALWGLTDERPRSIAVNRNWGRNRTEKSRPESGWSIEMQIRVRTNLPEQPAIIDGIPVLPVPELLVDVAGSVTERQLESLVSAASQKKHLDERVVAGLLEAGKGRKGIEMLRDQLRYWDPEMRNALSVLETKFIRICREKCLEIPATNRWVCGLMVDFLWARHKVVLEVDGYAFHGDRAAFERDHDRPAILMRGGYLRLSFTWRQVVEDPEAVVATVIVALSTWNRA